MTSTKYNNEIPSLYEAYVTHNEFRPVADKVQELAENNARHDVKYDNLAEQFKSANTTLGEIKESIDKLNKTQTFASGMMRGSYYILLVGYVLIQAANSNLFNHIYHIIHG